jgi:hypothetical protein
MLDGFCLYGCFSRTQYVVFAAKLANEGPKLGRDKSHIAGSVRASSPTPGSVRATPLNPDEPGQQVSLLTTFGFSRNFRAGQGALCGEMISGAGT